MVSHHLLCAISQTFCLWCDLLWLLKPGSITFVRERKRLGWRKGTTFPGQERAEGADWDLNLHLLWIEPYYIISIDGGRSNSSNLPVTTLEDIQKMVGRWIKW